MRLDEAKISACVMWSLGHRADAGAWSEVAEVWDLLLHCRVGKGWDLQNWLLGDADWRQSLETAMKRKWKSERKVKKVKKNVSSSKGGSGDRLNRGITVSCKFSISSLRRFNHRVVWGNWTDTNCVR